MSELVCLGIARSLLHVLTSPALNEFKLLWGHEKQFNKLHRTIAIIEKVQLDADRRQVSEPPVQEWLTQLKLVLLEVDDLLDLISAKHLHEKARTGSKIEKQVLHVLSKPRNFIFFVKTAHKVKGMRKSLDDIASDIKGFNFLPVQTEQNLLPYGKNRDPTHSYVSAKKVIGREKEMEDIVKMLLPEGLEGHMGDVVPVVVVIGIGGLGKTTLAQLVRNDDRVIQGFDLCIWSCINYFSPLKKVLVELIKSATQGYVEEHDLDTLQSMFRKVIQGKRFLLVLDDVWDENGQNWRNLKVLLDSGKTGSMILATTRSIVVAQRMNASKPYYHLEGLSDESAWSLFKEEAFLGKEEKHCQDLEELGRQIVKKCGNVPIAIVIIGSSLKDKEKNGWVSVLNEELSKVVTEDHNKIMHILKISYNEFPYPVKSCFAYCALFPKNYTFKKEVLVRLWIAQGYVESCPSNSSKHQSLEHTAEGYFNYLVDRCFFSDVECMDGVKITCRMHDLVHDLATEVAKLESVLFDKTTLELSSKTIRHVSIFDEYGKSCVEKVCSFSHSKKIRTCILNPLPGIDVKKLISCFRGIRVLYLGNREIVEIPASIGNLIHLRYLDLSFSNMETLTNSICSLHHLQYLILEGCSLLKELPRDLVKLLSLRHLVLNGCYALREMPCGLAIGLAASKFNWQLDKLIVECCKDGLKYLECLKNVSGHLAIQFYEDGWKDATMGLQESRFFKNERLHTLYIYFRGRRRSTEVDDLVQPDTLMDALEPPDRVEYMRLDGKKILAWVMCFTNLVTLTIRDCHVCVELPPLSRLQSLKELKIKKMPLMLSVEGSGAYDPAELFFPSLETLTMQDMPNLRSWWLEEPIVLPTFPRLVKVRIRNCPKLTTCVPWFPYVEDLELRSVGESVLWQSIGSNVIGSSALKELEISFIEDLRRIGEAQIRHISGLQTLIIESCPELETVSCRGLAYLTSLEELSISGCAKLKWVDGGDNQKKIEVLSRLEDVRILNVNMWFFNTLRCTTSLQRLDISGWNKDQQSVSVREEEEEMMVPWGTLHELEYLSLEFGEMRRNKYLLKGVQNLTSLQQLSLGKCKELHMPWRALLSLKHLKILSIEDVEKVIEVDYDSQIQLISSNLQQLKMRGGSGEWLPDIPWKSLSSLFSLYLFNISDMKALPDEIQHLTTLQVLVIFCCKRVVSLPSWISSLSLSRLLLKEVSEELKKRCENPTGEDWPLIRHIQNVTL